MKKWICAMLCVIFICSLSVKPIFAINSEQITFSYNDRTYTYSLDNNIKFSDQFDINFEINKYDRFSSRKNRQCLLKKMLDAGFDERTALNYLFPNLDRKIEKIARSIERKPENSSVKINSNSENAFSITEEKVGYLVDRNKIYTTLSNYYLNEKNLNIEVAVNIIQPEIKAEEIKKYTNLRADFSTNISSSSPDRKHNVKNALATLNKIEILPGEIFSFNKTIGKRTKENGYRQAKIIVNNEFVDGLGGGVCQVSTTLYNAALMAGLKIIEANKHSKQVGYVKSGFDAMVNFGSSDLKFENTTNEKLTIITNYSSSIARVRIYGESLNNVKYKLTSEVFNIVEPSEEILIDKKGEYLDKVKYEDEYFVKQKGSRGVEVKSYREKYVNGTLIDRTLLRHDKFNPQNTILVYGAYPREENDNTN